MLLKEYGTRECKVVLHKYVPKKKFLSEVVKNSSVRSNVPWLPKTPTIEGSSKVKLAAIATGKNGSNAATFNRYGRE